MMSETDYNACGLFITLNLHVYVCTTCLNVSSFDYGFTRLFPLYAV